MKKQTIDDLAPRPLNYSNTVRGKYYKRMQEGTNLVILDPALISHFPDSESVNRALHAFLAIGDSIQAATKPRRRAKSTTTNSIPAST